MKTLIKMLLFPLLLTVAGYCQSIATGNITASGTTCATANACIVALINQNTGGAMIQLSGTFTGTVQFESSIDNVTWVAINGTPLNSTTGASSATAAGIWQFNVAGAAYLRARASAYSAGPILVAISPSTASARSGGGGGGSGTTVNNVTCAAGKFVNGFTAPDLACTTVSAGSNIIPVSLGVTQGAAGCSITGSFLAAAPPPPNCFIFIGGSLSPQRGVPSFPTAGAIGTGTAIYREIILPSNYTANANLVLHIETACVVATTSTVTFSLEYADSALLAQSTFFATPYVSNSMSVVASPTTVAGTITVTPNNAGSPATAPGDQLFYILWLSASSGGTCAPIISKEYWTF